MPESHQKHSFLDSLLVENYQTRHKAESASKLCPEKMFYVLVHSMDNKKIFSVILSQVS